MTSTTKSPLQTLWKHCQENLHKKDGLLSLRQLAPIHQTMFQCTILAVSNVKAELSKTTSSGGPLEAILHAVCPDPQDQALAQPYLQPQEEGEDAYASTEMTIVNDAHKLFWLQYLMFPLDLEDALTYVLIPYLVDSSPSTVSEDLEIALLDWMVQSMGSIKDSRILSTSSWPEILRTLVASSSPSAGRLLVKLVEMDPTFAQASPSEATPLIPALYDKIWQTMQAAMKIPLVAKSQTTFQDHPILSSMSKDLIPILTTSSESETGNVVVLKLDSHQPHVHTLWLRLTTLWSDACGGEATSNDDIHSERREKKRLALLVITTILCPLLPHLVQEELPLAKPSEATNQSCAIPLDQPILWEWMFYALSQGKSFLEDGSALSSILRRRALFLLNSIVVSNEWRKYVMCFETLEMEQEQHLVDQVWESVGSLCASIIPTPNDKSVPLSQLTWEWMSLLFGCVLSSYIPVVGKLGMYRVLKAAHDHQWSAGNSKAKGDSKSRKKSTEKSGSAAGNILEHMPADFVLRTLLPSWNYLGKNVGYTMHVELPNRKLDRVDMIPLMENVLKSYAGKLRGERAEAFWEGLFQWDLIKNFTTKTLLLVFGSLAEALKEISDQSWSVPMKDATVQSLTYALQHCFSNHAVVLAHRRSILEAISIFLSKSSLPEDSTARVSPMATLGVLSLYQRDYFKLSSDDWDLHDEPILQNLRLWISGLTHKDSVAAALAAAFVDGQLGLNGERRWDPEHGATDLEIEQAWGVVLFATLIVDPSTSASAQLMWPAINKGLSLSSVAIITKGTSKADHVTRALLLLEGGCLLRQLSGLGNGDMVVDKKTQQMMPPPPNVEELLSKGIDFLMFHIRLLFSIEANEASNGAMQTSKTYAWSVNLLRVLYQSYPSSNVLTTTMDDLLKNNVKALSEKRDMADGEKVMHATLIYAALSSGALPSKDSYASMCRQVLAVSLHGDTKQLSNTWEHMARSILFFTKWASISKLLQLMREQKESDTPDQGAADIEFLKWILEQCFEAVHVAAYDAIVPVFNAVIESAKLWGLAIDKETRNQDDHVDIMDRIVHSLIDLMKDATQSHEGIYMLNEVSALLFQPTLLFEEYERFETDQNARLPIRDGFRALLQMAGKKRPHITRSVVCRITLGWLGSTNENDASIGLRAIPYQKDIVELLMHKETRMDESNANQSRGEVISGGVEIPSETNELSVTRAFLLVFFSRLPSTSDGLDVTVQRDLLEPTILDLLCKAEPIKSNKQSLVMKGTPLYSQKMRAWQALCILSRFVSANIAQQVSDCTFRCVEETIHSQVRYFVEVFAIKCATMHQKVFGDEFLRQIVRSDLSLQQIASLMIMGGNWIVGRYKLDFFSPEGGDSIRLKTVVAGTIPWLSSTQGFSRAIAQLLVYAVIPLVVDIKNTSSDPFSGDSDWLYKLIYEFLDTNKEMIRLRKKQAKFFDTYQIEDACTPEGVLSIPVDEGDESDPAHLVDVIKKTLVEVYDEAHGSEAPVWKQVAAMLKKEPKASLEGSDATDSPDLVNFQRKIIPLDALNLAMESQRAAKLKNATGKRKQQLIVCAALIDKIPNLGGLARTSEIFAADRLVIPDKSVCKMDNFRSISVGAGEWIDIEEVRPEGLLDWLLAHKSKGYFIFGLEQTASSVSLDTMEFPDRPTILLLGKEKEGIPVEFLQAVDQCVEIPQLGMIRSLNVHVSGAIAIWEHTKQRRLKSIEK